jgi:hypothetical protein
VLHWVRAHAPAGSDLAILSHEEPRHIAEDLSLAESEPLAMATRGRDNTTLVEGMMRARGLDPDQVRHAFVTLVRDGSRHGASLLLPPDDDRDHMDNAVLRALYYLWPQVLVA